MALFHPHPLSIPPRGSHSFDLAAMAQLNLAPSLVLLDRNLFFSHDEAVFAGETEGGREPIGCASKGKKRRPSDEEYRDAITAYLRSLKPDARLADPPKLSSISLLRPKKPIPPLCRGVTSAYISSGDKYLVALYAGNTNRGCFLIYDARKNSLSTIPQLPFDNYNVSIGRHTAVVVCEEGGDGAGYTLAELVRVESSDFAAVKLYLWNSSAEEWIVKAGSLPHELCRPDVYFSADMCFHYRGTSLCWVDLLKGILVCDLSERGYDPNFSFVPLPKRCTTYGTLMTDGREIVAELFRSMACVGDVIKFVTMDGYFEERFEDLKLTIWTLSSDLLRWERSKVYEIEKIWASETYQSIGLSKIHPSFPVLSTHEADVVYLVFTDIRLGAKNIPEFKGQYVLRVDMKNSEVQISQASTGCTIHSQLFASEFSAYGQPSPVISPRGGSKRKDMKLE